ncbi:DNA-binding protein inhibitor ID-2b isoform X2 [Trichomycterus rosablanca]|uniref:DNA-binding protein inhibitor ID-2b isoform X2 n=1 Tax=Trichomycterus rosablanca TaxID=2290929 RepID=UPI002F358488
MKAISPVLPLRRNHIPSYSQDHSLGISPGKSVWDEPLGVLCDMNDCYSRLKELVPSLPQDRSVSNIEILQHVIDYILDLQIALDSSSTNPSPAPQRCLRSAETSGSADTTSSFSPLSNFSRETTTDELTRISR